MIEWISYFLTLISIKYISIIVHYAEIWHFLVHLALADQYNNWRSRDHIKSIMRAIRWRVHTRCMRDIEGSRPVHLRYCRKAVKYPTSSRQTFYYMDAIAFTLRKLEISRWPKCKRCHRQSGYIMDWAASQRCDFQWNGILFLQPSEWSFARKTRILLHRTIIHVRDISILGESIDRQVCIFDA